MDEYFEIYDKDGLAWGAAPRSICHGNPDFVHCTVHVVVRNHAGALLLQKRNAHKDIQPGKWDTAVGGHVKIGEALTVAAVRETAEELGIAIAPSQLKQLFTMQIRNAIESENVTVFGLEHEGPFFPQVEEVDEVRFFQASEWRDPRMQEEFTPNLREEIKMLESFNLL